MKRRHKSSVKSRLRSDGHNVGDFVYVDTRKYLVAKKSQRAANDVGIAKKSDVKRSSLCHREL